MKLPYLARPIKNACNIGKEVIKHLSKKHEPVAAHELQAEMQKKVKTALEDIIATHKNFSTEYYIVIENQRFPKLPGVVRQFEVVRKSRPQPFYDQSLFSYNNHTCELKYWWTLPDKETYFDMLAHPENVPKEQQQLLGFVLEHKHGRLF